MPTYEYRCDSCEKNFDVVQSFHDDPLTSCPTCGSPVRKVFGNVGIVFKGSGFYKNDSRSGGSGKAPAEGAAAAASGTDGSGSDGSGSDGSGSDGSGSDELGGGQRHSGHHLDRQRCSQAVVVGLGFKIGYAFGAAGSGLNIIKEVRYIELKCGVQPSSIGSFRPDLEDQLIWNDPWPNGSLCSYNGGRGPL